MGKLPRYSYAAKTRRVDWKLMDDGLIVKPATAAPLVSIPSSQTEVRELSPKAHHLQLADLLYYHLKISQETRQLRR
jgi:hypothetical protein